MSIDDELIRLKEILIKCGNIYHNVTEIKKLGIKIINNLNIISDNIRLNIYENNRDRIFNIEIDKETLISIEYDKRDNEIYWDFSI